MASAWWLRCKVLPGPFETERVVLLHEMTRGSTVQLIVDSDLVQSDEPSGKTSPCPDGFGSCEAETPRAARTCCFPFRPGVRQHHRRSAGGACRRRVDVTVGGGPQQSRHRRRDRGRQARDRSETGAGAWCRRQSLQHVFRGPSARQRDSRPQGRPDSELRPPHGQHRRNSSAALGSSDDSRGRLDPSAAQLRPREDGRAGCAAA